MKRPDPYIEALKEEELRQLRELPENLQADDPDDFRSSMTMWALMTLAAVGFAIWVM